MKKRVKLLTTIASLCLAVALMAFGVYAAQTDITKEVSGSITFEATGFDGTWTLVSAMLDDTKELVSDGTIGTATVTSSCEIVVTASFKNNSDVDVELYSADNGSTSCTVAGAGPIDCPAGETVEISATVTYTNTDDTKDASASYKIIFTASLPDAGDEGTEG